MARRGFSSKVCSPADRRGPGRLSRVTCSRVVTNRGEARGAAPNLPGPLLRRPVRKRKPHPGQSILMHSNWTTNNPIALDLLSLGGHHLVSRRCYYLLPSYPWTSRRVRPRPGRPVLTGEPTANHLALGPEFGASEIEQCLREHNLTYQRVSCIEETVAGLLQQQKIVGWSQGKMEIGPRVPGNRSLLADPRTAHPRDVLNAKVKLREESQPFAPNVLESEAPRWFDIPKLTPAARGMLMTYN